MCLRSGPPAVFLDGGRPGTPFLDDLIGWSLADRLRSLGGNAPLDGRRDNPYALMCGGPDSYLACAFSSPWALGVLLVSFAAGLMPSSRRKTAFAILGGGAAVSLMVTGIRVAGHEPGIYRDRVFEVLPIQLAANLLFQTVLPFAVALLLVRIGALLRGGLAGKS